VRSCGREGLVRADGAHRHSSTRTTSMSVSPMKARRRGDTALKIELLRRTVGVNASAGEHQNEALALK